MAAEIAPGFLTARGAESITFAMGQIEGIGRKLDEMVITGGDEFPAKLTAYDSATGRCSWTERWYNASGVRLDKPGGMTGSTTFAPAYPVGNGLMPPTSFPVDVWLRRRIVTATLGPVYEFDWICGCTAGSGSGSGNVITACCPSGVPASLSVTFTVTAGSCAMLDGQTITVASDGFHDWTGEATLAGHDITVDLGCVGGTVAWVCLIQDLTSPASVTGTSSPGACSPLLITMPGLTIGSCPGAIFTVTVSE